ncbi:MAG TPA: DotU family type VI secretion system protein [Burkholderiaceae bacterium]|nr:DotU family type VI secretion system protein [Burkholderiaceae bacterium]
MSQPPGPPDDDRTIIIPSPGGRGRGARPVAPAAPPPAAAAVTPRVTPQAAAAPPQLVGGAEPLPASGLSPLLAAANPLLNLVPQLRASATHANPAALREQLAQAIRRFDTEARAAGVPNEKAIAARYVLCTLLDESAASTPWGGSGVWAHHSLLVLFHNEAWGGEKFFQLLGRLAENPGPNRDLLELMYVCLALGFQGRFAVAADGRNQLEALRERLAQMLRGQAGYERELSPRWAGIKPPKKSLLGEVPLWVGLAAAGLVLLLVYLGLSIVLNNRSDPVYAGIQAVRATPIATAPPAAPARAAPPRLARFLQNEIAAGLVAVKDDGTRSVVTLRGDGLFAPGSDRIAAERVPLLLRIADALNETPGTVVVAGHSDNQPIRSLRFPSNWHLSNARAEAVTALLATRTPPARLKSEGRADAEPVADNATPEGRARNRRVDITLFVPGDLSAAAASGPR